MDSSNEEQLVKRLSEGDEKAFRVLFMRYYPKIRCFLNGLLKSETEAEDLTQDVFVKIWMNRTRFAEVNTFGAYLYVLAKNTAFNYIESKQIRQVGLDERPFEEEYDRNPYEELVAKDLQLFVNMVVDSMPSQRQAVYRMSRESGLTNDEIAEKLHLAKKTVENHLNLALKELRNAMLLFVFLYFC